MADKSKIEWTDATWNPIRGCRRVSPGCVNCYAEAVAARFSGVGQAYEGLAKMTDAGPRWTGQVRFIPEHLEDPMRWTRPRRIFVNSMSDLFHEDLPDASIRDVFEVMRRAPHHTYQVLTKRAHRMRAWMDAHPGYANLPQTWNGVSVEDQKSAEERIPVLASTPAAVRWLSVEPMIGPVDVPPAWLEGIDWVVIGGESGNRARAFNLKWARHLIKLCRAAGVAVFLKQLGRVPVVDEPAWRQQGGTEYGRLLNGNAYNRITAPEGTVPLALGDRKGGHPLEWPEDLRVREYPERSAP